MNHKKLWLGLGLFSLSCLPAQASDLDFYHLRAEPSEYEANVAYLDFPDLEDAIHLDGISYLNEKKVMIGQEDGNYLPKKELNRAEVAAALMRLNPSMMENFDTPCFPDMENGVWYQDPVCSMKKQGWIKGYDDGLFRANKPVSFTEALKMSFNALGISPTLLPQTQENPRQWYEQYLPKANMIQLLNLGKEEELDKYVNRETFAQMILMEQEWQAKYAHRANQFEAFKATFNESAGVWNLKDTYPLPWTLEKTESKYMRNTSDEWYTAKLFDANGTELPIDFNFSQAVTEYKNWVTFPAPEGGMFGVNLETGEYRFDELPSYLPNAYYRDGKYVIALRHAYCMNTLGNTESYEGNCALLIYAPDKGSLYVLHETNRDDGTTIEVGYDTPYDAWVLGSGILELKDDHALVTHYNWECHGFCYHARFYYDLSSGRALLRSRIWAEWKNVHRGEGELIYHFDVFPEEGDPFENTYKMNIERDGNDGLSPFIKDPRNEIRETYTEFYNSHPEFQPWLHPNAANEPKSFFEEEKE